MEASGDIGIRSRVLGRISERGRGGFSLRMAPMIDMIFLLLIFFVVAAKWRPQEDFLPFRLPTASAAAPIVGRADPLLLHISPSGNGCAVSVAGSEAVELSEENFDAGLARLMGMMGRVMHSQKRTTSDPVEIVCDREVRWENVAKVYNLLCSAGLSDITFEMTE